VQNASSTSSSEFAVSARRSLRFVLRAGCGLALSGLVWTACTWLFLRGSTDEAYLRVASPRQASLILGTSRAAQGLVPGEVDTGALGVAGPMFNFAFTSATSRWGPAYLGAIERKLTLNEPRATGLFILEVSPLSITVKQGEGLREDASFLARLKSVSLNPNVEYPFYNAERGVDILEGLLQLASGNVRKQLHPDGWLEVTVPDRAQRFESRFRGKMIENRRSFDNAELSPVRLEYLARTIALLQTRGRVVLARLPVHPEMLALENSAMPEFSSDMVALSKRFDVPYVDMTDLSASVNTTDGSHLEKSSSRSVTRELVARLRRLPMQP
jgi:hypothetical protein